MNYITETALLIYLVIGTIYTFWAYYRDVQSAKLAKNREKADNEMVYYQTKKVVEYNKIIKEMSDDINKLSAENFSLKNPVKIKITRRNKK